jgi:hypothetical protein
VPTEGDSAETLKKKNEIFKMIEDFDKFNRRQVCRYTEDGQPVLWAYVIPEWKASAFTKPIDALLEDIPAPEPPTEPTEAPKPPAGTTPPPATPPTE